MRPPTPIERILREGGVRGRGSCQDCARKAFSELLYAERSVDVGEAVDYHRRRARWPPPGGGPKEAGVKSVSRYPNLSAPGFAEPYVFLDFSGLEDYVAPNPDLLDLAHPLDAPLSPSAENRILNGAGSRRVLGFLLVTQPLSVTGERRAKIPRSMRRREPGRLFLRPRSFPTGEELFGEEARGARSLLHLAPFFEEVEDGDRPEVVAPEFRVSMPLMPDGRPVAFEDGSLAATFCDHPRDLSSSLKSLLLAASIYPLNAALFALCCVAAATSPRSSASSEAAEGGARSPARLDPVGEVPPNPRASKTVRAKLSRLRIEPWLTGALDTAGAERDGLLVALERRADLFEGSPAGPPGDHAP